MLKVKRVPRLTLLGRSVALITGEVLANALLWALAGALLPSRILSLAVIAWTLGLRHGLDADHILAIDNATRRFIALGRLPVTAGLFFSLGHSTIVIVVTLAIVISASVIDNLDGISEVGGVIGASVSASFLLILACINGVVLYKALRARRHPKEQVEINGGCLFRLFKPLLRAIDAPWKLYFVGAVFGLGFDTASSILLLGVSATAGERGDLPPSRILLLPLLFTAGMTAVDSLDSIGMLWSYALPDRETSGWRGWRLIERTPSSATLPTTAMLPKDVSAPAIGEAEEGKGASEEDKETRPSQLSTLSIALTAISVVMALVISFITFMGIAAEKCESCAEAAENDDGLSGRWWRFWIACNDSSGFIGAGLVGTMLLLVALYFGFKWFVRRQRTAE